MGYSTDFNGRLDIDKPLRPEHAAYLRAFSRTRRMKRNAECAASLVDPLRLAAGLPVGADGGYYVGDNDDEIEDHNESPSGQPGLWCQWVPSEDGKAIEWDGGEKFYSFDAARWARYVEWLQYIVTHFLAPWGYALSGQVEWQGQDGAADSGKIVVRNNEIKRLIGRVVYEEES